MNIMRAMQILGRIGQPTTGPYQQGQAIQPVPEESGIEEMFPDPAGQQMGSPAMDRYTSAIGQMPQREDYQPSKMRRLGAIVAGFGQGVQPAGMWGGNPVGFRGNPAAAFETASGIKDQPFTQEMTDWQAELGPLAGAAKIEQDALENDRQRKYQEGQLELGDRRIIAGEEKEANRHALDQKKYELAKWKAENPDGQLKVDSSGYIVVIDPASGGSINTGIMSNEMSALDKHKLQIEEIQARGGVEAGLIDRRAGAASDLEAQRGVNRRQGTILAGQENIDRDAARRAGSGFTETVTNQGRTQTRTRTPNTSGTSGQRVNMTNKSGQRVSIAAEDVEQALREGYTR